MIPVEHGFHHFNGPNRLFQLINGSLVTLDEAAELVCPAVQVAQAETATNAGSAISHPLGFDFVDGSLDTAPCFFGGH